MGRKIRVGGSGTCAVGFSGRWWWWLFCFILPLVRHLVYFFYCKRKNRLYSNDYCLKIDSFVTLKDIYGVLIWQNHILGKKKDWNSINKSINPQIDVSACLTLFWQFGRGGATTPPYLQGVHFFRNVFSVIDFAEIIIVFDCSILYSRNPIPKGEVE